MAKPQQPEIARSGHGATDPGSVKSSLTTPGPTPRSDTGTPVPEDNTPGHHPEHEQDKPSGKRFVEKVHEHALDTDDDRDPDPTIAGDALRATAAALRKVRKSLPDS
jgi:hypothetical protein